jgi:hypothetical protein
MTSRGACFSVTLASISIRFIPSLSSFIFKISGPPFSSVWGRLVFRGFLLLSIVCCEKLCSAVCCFVELFC